MNYSSFTKKINSNDYDCIVGVGNKCPTVMILKKLGIYKDSYPFDYIPSTPQLILKYLHDHSNFLPEKNKTISNDGIWFGHFSLDDANYDNTKQTFNKRFERLFNKLQNKKKILFIYSSEADIYNELGNRYSNNYKILCEIKEYIRYKYAYDDFTIVAIHTNKTYKNDKNIMNYNINVPDEYLSNNMETHNEKTTSIYRTVLESLLKEIFNK